MKTLLRCAALSLAPIVAAGCGRSQPTEAPIRTSPVPQEVAGFEFIDDAELEGRAVGAVWLDRDSGTVHRVSVASGRPEEEQVQDRAIATREEVMAISSMRVLDDDTIFVAIDFYRDGRSGTELRTYVPGEPVVVDTFGPGTFTFDARERGTLWTHHAPTLEADEICRRTRAETQCFTAPDLADDGVPARLYVGSAGRPYLTRGGRLFLFSDDGSWTLVDEVLGPSELLRRGDADVVLDFGANWYVLEGTTARLVADRTHGGVDVYGVGTRVVIQQMSWDGTGGASSVGGALTGGFSGSTYWTQVVWTELDLATGTTTELGHETCDLLPSAVGPGCFRSEGTLFATEDEIWIFGRPHRALAWTPGGI